MLIRNHSDIEHLTKAAMNAEHRMKLTGVPARMNQKRLAPAAALAFILDQHDIDLPTDRALRVLIAGAEDAELIDEGAWFQVTPSLMGTRFDIDVDLLTYSTVDLRSDSKASSELQRARIINGTLADYADTHGFEGIDLVIKFHPGYEKYHASWFDEANSDALKTIINAGIPLFMSSYDEFEYNLDRQFVQEYGFELEEYIDNPFSFDPTDGRSPLAVGFANVIARFANKTPAAGHQPDPEALKSFQLEGVGSMGEIHIEYAERIIEQGRAPEDAVVDLAHIILGTKDPREVHAMLEQEDFSDYVHWVLTSAIEKQYPELAQSAPPMPTPAEMAQSLGELMEDSGLAPEQMEQMIGQLFGQPKEGLQPLTESQEGLFAAVDTGDFPMFKRLVLSNPSDIHAENEEGATLWFPIAQLEDFEPFAEMLRDGGVDLTERDNEGWTPLVNAIYVGNTSYVEWLLKLGANPNEHSGMGHLPLFVAASNGQIEAIDLLVKYGADLQAPDMMGNPIGEVVAEMRQRYEALSASE